MGIHHHHPAWILLVARPIKHMFSRPLLLASRTLRSTFTLTSALKTPTYRTMSSSSSSAPPPTPPTFEKTPLPDLSQTNPLGKGKYISTAACIIIGDEVLNGKTKDSN